MLEPTETNWTWLRRFTFTPNEQSPEGSQGHRSCPVQINGHDTGHDAITFVGTASDGAVPSVEDIGRDDPRWPDACERCGMPFLDDDEWQVFEVSCWRMPDGDLVSIHPNERFGPQAPPGAM